MGHPDSSTHKLAVHRHGDWGEADVCKTQESVTLLNPGILILRFVLATDGAVVRTGTSSWNSYQPSGLPMLTSPQQLGEWGDSPKRHFFFFALRPQNTLIAVCRSLISFCWCVPLHPPHTSSDAPHLKGSCRSKGERSPQIAQWPAQAGSKVIPSAAPSSPTLSRSCAFSPSPKGMLANSDCAFHHTESPALTSNTHWVLISFSPR